MKLLQIIFFLLCSFLSYSQNLQIQGDSTIVLIEQGKSIELDSAQIQLSINEIAKQIDVQSDKLKDLEVMKAKLLEEKNALLERYNYLFEIRFRHFKLSKELKSKK